MLKTTLAASLIALFGISLSIIPNELGATMTKSMDDDLAAQFYQRYMLSDPIRPADETFTMMQGLAERNQLQAFISSDDINYDSPKWQQRVFAQSSNILKQEQGRVAVIDSALSNNELVYRYLSNGTHDELFEPWSSSKVMAITGAMVKANKLGFTGDFQIGEHWFSDIITSIHSYQPSNLADGNSNALASYLVNAVGRDYLSSLFHKAWLNLSPANISLRGAYGTEVFQPSQNVWADKDKQIVQDSFNDSASQSGYLSYRCESCGLTGNKPMTTLALVEWLKRLIIGTRDPNTHLSDLSGFDTHLLFYGKTMSHIKTDELKGMQAGISNILALAIYQHLEPDSKWQTLELEDIEKKLNSITDGKWRIFQKVGWGYSETRGAGEMVYLAHVSLPFYKQGREFTIAAQVGIDGENENKVHHAGLTMLKVLKSAVAEVLQND